MLMSHHMPPLPCVSLPAADTCQLLSGVRSVWRQQGAAVQAEKAHSSYQRSIAGTLARLRVMHVLEDTSTGRGAPLKGHGELWQQQEAGTCWPL